MKRLGLLPFVLLAACGTPQEQCISYNTRDLRVVDRLIGETEGNLDRGFAYVRVTEYEDYWAYCAQPQQRDAAPVAPRLCRQERAITVDRPKAIDLADEARKLDSLRIKRQELSRRAEAVIAQCKKNYPE